ncbi:MAG: RIP metalloprotease RseP [Bdellovibrionaceae bacterium]|nr:RIP metalloprotease RseP [Pseudobdellovibrionaceae bacterium]
MDLILHYLLQGVSFVVPMTILLGVLIFIHELGHFAVAKFFGVKVETFSLGFGPKIFKMIRGETTYCLSAIPFGGYVKMYGDEIGGEVPADQKHRSFLDKPIYQRILIALAGPVMNLALAFVLFLVLSIVGESVVAPRLGDIDNSTYAYALGFRSGDRILSINNAPMTRWEDVEKQVAEALGSQLEFRILRETEEEPVKIIAKVEPGESPNPLEPGKTIGTIAGLDFINNASLVAVSDPSSLFGKLGFKTGDKIMAINNMPVNTYRAIQEVLLSESSNTHITFDVERYGLSAESEPEKIKLTWDLKQIPFPDSVKGFGYHLPETFIGEVVKDSPAAIAGLEANDRLLSINNHPIEKFSDIVDEVNTYRKDSPPLNVKVVRGGQEKTFNMTPKMTEIKSEIGEVENRFAIGIRPITSRYVEHIKWTAPNASTALTWSLGKTWQWTEATVMSFVLLVRGQVSPKNLGGFISIGQMAKKSWEYGLDAFLRIMAIISLNLFILNLLPVPVLDGGHILLFSIEGIRGTPISLRKLEIAQQIGVFVLLSLLAFSLFNDFSRLFGS